MQVKLTVSMIIDEGDDLGCDDIREYVINAGRAIHPY